MQVDIDSDAGLDHLSAVQPTECADFAVAVDFAGSVARQKIVRRLRKALEGAQVLTASPKIFRSLIQCTQGVVLNQKMTGGNAKLDKRRAEKEIRRNQQTAEEGALVSQSGTRACSWGC